MSITWTILDRAGADLLADFGFATYVDFAERQPGQKVAQGGTTRTTRLSVRSEPRTEVRGGSEPRTEVRSGGGANVLHMRTSNNAHLRLPPPTPVGSSEAESAVFFIKVYRYAGRQWRHRFRRGKASLEAANYALLDGIGIRTPPVVAYGSRRRGLRLMDAVIVTRGLPDVVSLDPLFASRWPNADAHTTDAMRRDVLNAVLRDVRLMHDAGFFHIDLQWRNILIGGLKEDRIDVYLLDAPRGGIRRSPWGLAHARLRDLSCLLKEARRRMRRTEQMRWLLTYLDEPRLMPRARAIAEALLLDRTVKDNQED